jgi:hypothetical protein
MLAYVEIESLKIIDYMALLYCLKPKFSLQTLDSFIIPAFKAYAISLSSYSPKPIEVFSPFCILQATQNLGS